MNRLTPFILIAVLANLITVLLYNYAAIQPGGSGATMEFSLFWMPGLWLTSIIATAILCFRYRKELFKRYILKFSLPLILFCTPIPIWAVTAIFWYQESYNAGTLYIQRNGYVLKHEEWMYYNGKQAIDKYYRLASDDQDTSDDSNYPKDSVWTYFNKNGDTIKTELYSNGKLLSTTVKDKSKK